MERPKNIKPHSTPPIKNRRTTTSVRLVIIFHLIGLIGLSVAGLRPIFLQLVPYHLLLMAIILLFNHEKFGTKIMLFFLLIFIIGFAVEWAGVYTGQLFGNYTYRKTLGFSIDGIPLIMGVNWFLLIYAVGVSLQQIRIKSIWIRLLAGAFVLVLLDLLIEPVAARLDYWHWAAGPTPIQNYGCWFIISLVLLFLFEQMYFKKQSIVGPALLVSQFIFFAALQ
jgi:putative membrane protein